MLLAPVGRALGLTWDSQAELPLPAGCPCPSPGGAARLGAEASRVGAGKWPHGEGRGGVGEPGSLARSVCPSVHVPAPPRRRSAPCRPRPAAAGGCSAPSVRAGAAAPPRRASRREPAWLPAGSGGRRGKPAPLPGDPLPAGEGRSRPRQGLTPLHLSRPGRAGRGEEGEECRHCGGSRARYLTGDITRSLRSAYETPGASAGAGWQALRGGGGGALLSPARGATAFPAAGFPLPAGCPPPLPPCRPAPRGRGPPRPEAGRRRWRCSPAGVARTVGGEPRGL